MQVTLNIPDEQLLKFRAKARKILGGTFPRVNVAQGEGKEMEVVELDNPTADPASIYLQDLVDDFCLDATIEHANECCKAKGATDDEKKTALLDAHNAEEAKRELRREKVKRAIPTKG